MLDLRSGGLVLDGIDVVLARENAPRRGRWSVFALGPGADLGLTGCTVTVEGDRTPSAVAVVEPAASADAPSAATIRIADCLIRAGGDVVDARGGRKLTVEIDNSVVASTGALIHARGVSRDAPPAAGLSATLRQVTARVAGGLVWLDATTAEPELPTADVNVRYSVLTTGLKDTPLLRVDGHDTAAAQGERVVWEGLGVVYHQVSLYRRDQSLQVGSVPAVFDRASWSVAVGSREKDATHGDARFLHPGVVERPAWAAERDGFRLDPVGPARSAGADLDRVPEPPPVS
jgi:hypothetical protein